MYVINNLKFQTHKSQPGMLLLELLLLAIFILESGCKNSQHHLLHNVWEIIEMSLTFTCKDVRKNSEAKKIKFT